jgi:hypothetical protein
MNDGRFELPLLRSPEIEGGLFRWRVFSKDFNHPLVAVPGLSSPVSPSCPNMARSIATSYCFFDVGQMGFAWSSAFCGRCAPIIRHPLHITLSSQEKDSVWTKTASHHTIQWLSLPGYSPE